MKCTECGALDIDIKPLYYVREGTTWDTGYHICLKCGTVMGEWCNK